MHAHESFKKRYKPKEINSALQGQYLASTHKYNQMACLKILKYSLPAAIALILSPIQCSHCLGCYGLRKF